MALVSKEEYLKRYLSGSDFEEKKKKRKKKPKQGNVLQSRMKIVDDDITVKDVAPSSKEEADLYEDEAPTVVGLVDDRPEEVQQLEVFRSNQQWKTFAEKGSGKQRHDSDSDQSPVRTRHDSDSDQSPSRIQRHDSGSDQSPARRQRHDSGSDQSPARRQRHDSGSDQSPPRRQRKDSGSDQSPPRRQRRDSSSDQSPPRRKKHNSDSDQSPPRRRRRNSDSDQSPPRRTSDKRKSEEVPKGTRRKKPSRFDAPLEPQQDDRGRAKKTLGGLTAGLSTARAMRIENDAKRKREQDMFDQASESMLGRNAKTVFRDKESGKRRNLVKEGEAEAKENAIKEEVLAKYRAWGKGLAQQEAQDKRAQEAVAEAERPLARMAGDDNLEAVLRDQEREGDPMLAFLRKKKTKSAAKDIPRYKGPQPPANRFNIWPGYRWDGVDRSNGFEKSLFSKRSERKAVEEDAYKWSVEDM